MADFRIDRELSERALASPRFDVVGTFDTDIATIGTWDRFLSRRTRILVPVDVQAYVVGDPASGAVPEQTVDVTGDPATDPRPLEPGQAKPAGVHLHWAMPDTLLLAEPDEATRKPRLDPLPDQWVVVRTLQPTGHRQVLATGWIVDSRTGTVTPLATFSGPVSPLPDGAIDPVDGFSLGVDWTASYAGARGRFTFHDPLTDLADLRKAATQGFHGGQAVYTVAGWWSEESRDPLAGARGVASLDSVLAGLRWRVDHDTDDNAHRGTEQAETALMRAAGLGSPTEAAPTEVVGSSGQKVSQRFLGGQLGAAQPVQEAVKVWLGDSLPRYHCLLHGSVLGVPVEGPLPAADDRPDPATLDVGVGSDVDDVVAALGADGLGLPADRRRAAEDLLAAFSNGSVAELGTPDGLDALGDREHAGGFWSLPGAPLPRARADLLRREDSLPFNPSTVGRKGRAGARTSEAAGTGKVGAESVAGIAWRMHASFTAGGTQRSANPTVDRVRPEQKPPPVPREVARPAPRYFRPAPLLVAVRNARPSPRHHGDGLFDDEGRLLCRYPAAAVPQLSGLISGAQLLPTLGSGAIPPEVLTVVREAVLLNPYGVQWTVDAAETPGDLADAATTRLTAEMVRLYGVDGTYDGGSHVDYDEEAGAANRLAWKHYAVGRKAADARVAVELSRLAIVLGQAPSPVAITSWRQPWVPLWLEWRVTLTGSSEVTGWELEGHDLERDPAASPPGDDVTTTLVGRSLLGRGVGEGLRSALRDWARAEASRQVTPGRASEGSGVTVQQLADYDHPLDLVGASLDGIREQLLGIDFVGAVARADGKPVATGEPAVLFGGTLRIDDLRLVDAFGRTLTVPSGVVDATRRTLELEVPGTPRTVLLRPRLQNAARWLWRLVDPGPGPDTPAEEVDEAFVDQVTPEQAVNPVAGFLLPDHIDEALEAFTVGGDPLGQVLHDPIGGAVTWECAPGRPLPPDAGPLAGLDAQSRLVGEIAAGMVRADAKARALPTPPASSALVTFLRAIDSTLWTVDTFASLGSAGLAGLVGRPVAVVRTTLTLDAPDDVDEVTVTATSGAAGRRAAYDELVEQQFEVQLGTLTRSDDTLLGYFVDDDYERLFLVDKVAAERARNRPTGRLLGHLGVLGTVEPPVAEDLHPYVSTTSRVLLRRGQTMRLTLLMLPGGRVHLTSGILPRKALALADSWVGRGLARLVPSVRVGPLLVDPGEIRLPLISVLGERQTFTRRAGELAWKDDPILAATQTAYLPRLPHEVQEGWVRVTPPEAEGTSPGGTP